MRARDLFLSGRRLGADEALRLGLVHRVIPLAELEAETTAYAQSIADNAPLTLAAIKRAFLEYEKDPASRDLGECAGNDRCVLQQRGLYGRPRGVRRKAQTEVYRQVAQSRTTLPGLNRFSGSSARLIARITGTASPCSASRKSSLPMPMPCSPVEVPLMASARITTR